MNIVLIGMPGSGKSTVGVLLAKATLKQFVDTDLIVQAKHGSSLNDIITKIGIDGFVKSENEILSKQMFDNTVVATGGSVVYGKEAMEALRQNSVVVYLKVEVEELKRRINNITTRGIAMPKGCTLEQLYNERSPLYESYADVTIDCSSHTAEECVEEIVNILSINN